MSRKFHGKCLFYDHREVPEEPRTHIELGGLGSFSLDRNSATLRENEANPLMRNRKEGGWRDIFREGEAPYNRNTITAGFTGEGEWLHPRRQNEHRST